MNCEWKVSEYFFPELAVLTPESMNRNLTDRGWFCEHVYNR